MYFFLRKIFILLLGLAVFFPVMALAGPGRTGAQILNLGGGARARGTRRRFFRDVWGCNHLALESKWTGRHARK